LKLKSGSLSLVLLSVTSLPEMNLTLFRYMQITKLKRKIVRLM